MGVFYIGGREGRFGVFRRLCVGMILVSYRINVVNAIRSLYAGKSDAICSDNRKHATDILC